MNCWVWSLVVGLRRDAVSGEHPANLGERRQKRGDFRVAIERKGLTSTFSVGACIFSPNVSFDATDQQLGIPLEGITDPVGLDWVPDGCAGGMTLDKVYLGW